ncbi:MULTISPECIES: IclR family transcriptional regulator [Haloferacaceae]|uniref:IclR family transcriptional regulator n=1 Tax=Halorubrum glutamatedens TaxID=2707018 RepID=A0ABD5QWF4_9EURY|nr:IclR family transcriptional regulator [Halobellus captivus]
MGTNNNKEVSAISRTIRIVETLHDLQIAGVTQIANSAELPKSSVYNHLRTLENRGYVIKNDGDYELGLRFLPLGEAARRRLDIYRASRTEIEQLGDDTGINAYLSVEERGRATVIFRHLENEIDLGSIGTTVPLTTSSMGKAILAQLPQKRIDEIIEQHGLPEMTESSIVDRDGLDEELEQIRQQGFALDRGEHVKRLRGVGAPVLGPDGGVCGAVSVAGPERELQDEFFNEELPDTVLDTTNIIELRLMENMSV